MNSSKINTTEKNKIPCAVIRDLFPSYIEGLTTEETNTEINSHLEGCEPCREVLDSMTEPEQEAHEISGEDKTELDFLKKTRMRNTGIVIAGIVGALALAAAVLFVRFYMIGSDIGADWVGAKVAVSGSDVIIEGSVCDSIHGISDVIFSEQDGVVSVRTKAVIASPLHWSEFHEEYKASRNVRQVIVNGRVYWDSGVNISALTGRVYETRHEYMGSMSDNARTAEALNIAGSLGGYSNELVTSEEPYRWRIILSEEQPAVRITAMNAYGYILLAAIRNLEEVEFEFTVKGRNEPISVLITKQDADEFFRQDIKKCYDSPLMMETLIKKTGFDDIPMMLILSEPEDSGKEDGAVSLRITNNCDDAISSISVSCYSGDKLVSSQGGQNADNSSLDYGQTLYFELLPEDFSDGSASERSVMISVETMDGKSYNIEEKIKLPPKGAAAAVVFITGNERDGFFFSKYGTIQ